MPQEWDLNRRIVIRKLPENATKTEILDLFSKYGEIKKIFIARNPGGFAFLEYIRRRDAETAVKKGNGKRCCGVYVSAELTIRDLNRTAVVRKLKRSVTKENLRTLFDGYGSIKRIWIERFQQTLAFVEYVHTSDTMAAVGALNGKRYSGAVIYVSLPTQSTNSRYQLRQTRDSTTRSSSRLSDCQYTNSSQHELRPRLQSSSRSRHNREQICDSTTNQTLECSICMENALENRPTSTICGHVFCEACIKRALARYEQCPKCRHRLQVKNLLRIHP